MEVNTINILKKEIAAAGLNGKKLARECGVSQMFISYLINGRASSDRVQKRIAEILGKSPSELFPEYYDRHPSKITAQGAVK